MTTLFSLVTIAYNDLNGLRRTVDSVDAQDFRDLEHLIVDGGSTDGTVDYLEALPEVPWRRWTSERDGGIYDAMNKGIDGGHGQLIMMLNSGDSLADASALTRIADSYRRDAWEWSYGGVRLVRPDGSHFGSYVFDPFHQLRFVLGLRWIPHATVVMTRSLVEKIGPYRLDLGTVADQEILMRALKSSPPQVIPEFLCHYETGGVSTVQGARERELAWHRMRKQTGFLVGGRLGDRLLSEALAAGPASRKLARRVMGGDGMYQP